MANGGFEKDRDTLKKLCPAKQYGVSCEGMTDCPVAQGIRIKLEEDRRIFTPIDRASYKWETEYNKRTAVERVNSRLDVSFGFENHTIRGLDKMKVRCGLALCIMLAMALGRIKENQPEKIRSLVS
ncbi:transposase [Virgibacillus sp. 179-BFC.A HS]|nr:transposase [Virgibacillus sp. 179-BFC.A HS]MDY0405161.1 transposase [Virgibacillus sp. 179-BFC.A HS]MDY0405280.1 transposase [Virgibacillus sp. 179-BFC.A HS]